MAMKKATLLFLSLLLLFAVAPTFGKDKPPLSYSQATLLGGLLTSLETKHG
jgi:hypothetical protein